MRTYRKSILTCCHVCPEVYLISPSPTGDRQVRCNLAHTRGQLARNGVEIEPAQDDGTTPLYQAALAGNAAAVETLLGQGADPNPRNRNNRWTALMVAGAEGFVPVVEVLVAAAGTDPNARGDLGESALHVAAERGNEAIVSLLLGHPRIEVDVRDHIGQTAMMRASFAGHARVVRLLLEVPGSEVNVVDRHRRTALHWAAMGGHLDVVDALLAHPDVNPAITNRPDGLTAGAVARTSGREDIARRLAAAEKDDDRDELPEGVVWDPPPEPDPGPDHPPDGFIPEPVDPWLPERER